MELKLHPFELPLRHEFRIARGARTSQRTMVVELSSEGQSGYGEATESNYYGVTLDTLRIALNSVRPLLTTESWRDPGETWRILHQGLGPLNLPGNSTASFALCALDEALWDLHGKLRGMPLHAIWGTDPEDCPASNYTLGIDTPEMMVRKLHEMPDWPIYKIKLGTDHDLELVRTLRKQTSAIFRVDANCGWTLTQARELIPPLADLGVEFVEQPLPAAAQDEQRALKGASCLPLIADESCLIEGDVAPCAAMFHGINIKLMKCGGLTPARRMIAAARSLGLRVMVGCMTESTVGISAIAQILPELDYVDMDGAVLLAGDVASGAAVIAGRCHFPERAGSGIVLLPNADAYRLPTHETA